MPIRLPITIGNLVIIAGYTGTDSLEELYKIKKNKDLKLDIANSYGEAIVVKLYLREQIVENQKIRDIKI